MCYLLEHCCHPRAQGPAGPEGEQGIQGEQGPPGPDKELQVRTVFGDELAVPADGSGQATATCAPDEVLTGAGISYRAPGNQLNPTVEEHASIINANEWEFTIFNLGPNTANVFVTAQCAKLVDVP